MGLAAFNRARQAQKEKDMGQDNIPVPTMTEDDRGKSPAGIVDGNASGEIDYESMTEDDLAAVAIEKGINIEDMTRRKVINVLKKVI